MDILAQQGFCREKNIFIGDETHCHLSGFNNFDDFQTTHKNWVESALLKNRMHREACSTKSIASGNLSYLEAVKNHMGGFAIGRKIQEGSEGFELMGPLPVCISIFMVENEAMKA